MVGETADRDGLSADLLRTVMQRESGFRPCAVSSKGAMGLMQLMPATAEQFGIDNPFDAASNLDGGARFLKQLLSRYGGDLPKALGAYNAQQAGVPAPRKRAPPKFHDVRSSEGCPGSPRLLTL